MATISKARAKRRRLRHHKKVYRSRSPHEQHTEVQGIPAYVSHKSQALPLPANSKVAQALAAGEDVEMAAEICFHTEVARRHDRFESNAHSLAFRVSDLRRILVALAECATQDDDDYIIIPLGLNAPLLLIDPQVTLFLGAYWNECFYVTTEPGTLDLFGAIGLLRDVESNGWHLVAPDEETP